MDKMQTPHKIKRASIMNYINVNLLSGDPSRISKSIGCKEIESIDGIKCLPETYIPIEPWLPLTSEEIKKLLVEKKVNYFDLTLLELPKKIKRNFEKLNFSKCINIHDVSYLQNSQEYKKILRDLLIYLRKHHLDNKDIVPHSIYFGKPNLHNNTFNSKDNVYIGMHLDSWEGDPITYRKKSRNRICINLGKESRYLLFYNIGLDTMAELANFDTENTNFDINRIYKEFAKKYLDWPIYRIEIKPFEAYVAPTEYIIHDGSSWNSSHPDINLVVRGNFFFEKPNLFTKIAQYINI